MSLQSLFRKKPQDPSADTPDFQSRAEEESADVRASGGRTKRKSTRQSNEPVDPMLPEKKRARRRLIGAVALVLAAIIGLPMILDGEQKPLGDDVVIQIPSRDQALSASNGGSSNTSSNGGGRIAASAALDPAEEIVSAAASPAKTETLPSTPPAAVANTAEKASPVANATSEKIDSPRPEPRSAEKTETPTAHKHVAKAPQTDTHHPDSVRAQAILDGGAASSKTEKKNAKVVVQVAALASKEKVSELQDKLKAAGIASFTQTVSTGSGPRIRVRIGPFGNKEEADAARGKLTRLGLNGTLIPG